MVSFEVHGDPHEVIAAVRLITPAVEPRQRRHAHPAPGLHQPPHRGPGRPAGRRVSDRLLRLSVGLEDVDDLWADLRTGPWGAGERRSAAKEAPARDRVTAGTRPSLPADALPARQRCPRSGRTGPGGPLATGVPSSIW